MMDYKVGEKVFYSRVRPKSGQFDVIELTVKKVTDKYISCTSDKEAHTFLFTSRDDVIFKNRQDALEHCLLAEEMNSK